MVELPPLARWPAFGEPELFGARDVGYALSRPPPEGLPVVLGHPPPPESSSSSSSLEAAAAAALRRRMT
jgi:hypothetical protein